MKPWVETAVANIKTKRSYEKVSGRPPCRSIQSFLVNPKPGKRGQLAVNEWLPTNSRRATTWPMGRPSFPVVLRHQFIPDAIWQPDNGRREPNVVPLQRDEHLNLWLQLTAGDDLVITYICVRS